MSRIVLLKAEEIAFKYDALPKGLALRYWKPSVFNWKPRGKHFKYYLYTLFHFTGIFKNKSFAFIELLDLHSSVSAASLLVVPAHFKYPFMEKKDIQFTYVMTKLKYREKNLAKILLKEAWDRRIEKSGRAWYVTDIDNKASIRVAERAGFVADSYGKREGGILNRLIKTES